MSGPHAIDAALDLARMPALAVSGPAPELPEGVVEVMRIAAAEPEACREAEKRTRMPAEALIEAARFYLQQTLFHPEADAFRVLGLSPGASRRVARVHMGWLLQWLHPDRNSGLDAIYTDRVLRAWREIANLPDEPALDRYRPPAGGAPHRPAAPGRRGAQIPWVTASRPTRRARAKRRLRGVTMRAVAVVVVIGVVVAVARLGGLKVGSDSFEALAVHLPIKLDLP